MFYLWASTIRTGSEQSLLDCPLISFCNTTTMIVCNSGVGGRGGLPLVQFNELEADQSIS